jgi:hypothetical protein
MGLSIALDELLTTGWSGLDSAGCSFDTDGRTYPTVSRVQREFVQAGFDLSITRVDRFNCFRAEWREPGSGVAAGSVVSNSEQEAAVYALAQLRRSLATV